MRELSEESGFLGGGRKDYVAPPLQLRDVNICCKYKLTKVIFLQAAKYL